ncbi:leucyl aminopeptidase [Gryllotalpicola protaetiae]|uniref:Probable cytosol aminopeptidase n=1 Tax=Gryllotalpicola protaetiae TaxID=2419771 RepID=A0A387BV85_9MICO|nr:leucyl aminopeptidase [Gryllotalpicola protaetiae]AYG05020.1 leucyl aminopeptidase [Gryllotalpicola protaetiae]
MTAAELIIVPEVAVADAEILVFAATADKPAPTVVGAELAPELVRAVAEQLPLVGFGGGADELARLAVDGRAIAVIGLGKSVTADGVRAAAGSAVRQLAGAASVALALTADDELLPAVLAGAALGSYSYDVYRTASKAGAKTPVARIQVVSGVADAAAALTRARVDADAVALVKDLFNQPPLDLYPETFVHAAREAVGHLPVAVQVWDEQALADEGFGGILGVGQGSTRGPRLAKLSYSPVGATQHLALVGKGITFDSGGLSLKPPTGMIGMKGDMTGAAVALAAVRAVAELELPVRVTAWLCLAENMPSGAAIRPGDVLRIRGGKTVEVLNTDAEGRLVMADGLVAASEEHPDQLIDVATLTGAKVTALGVRYSAVMGDDGLVDELRAAAADSGELLWPMPLPDELRATINSGIADLANANPGVAAGGMLLAGVFLREFVGAQADGDDAPRIPWAHLDIAGSEENKGGPYGFTGKGGTGVAVRLLVRHAERLAAAASTVG